MTSPLLLDERFERAARAHGPRTAVVAGDGERRTYAELLAEAEAVAGWLAAHGIGRGDRVGLVQPKDCRAVAALLGVLRAGAAYVPIDPISPAERARTILADCEVAATIVAPDLGELAPTSCAGHRLLASDDEWHALVQRAAPPPDRAGREADDLAYLLYTSGSTGVPKGVMLSHANARSFLDWAAAAFRPSPDDRFSSHAPFHFDLSVFDLYASLGSGAELHLIDADLGKNPRALGAFVEERRLTVWYSTPSVLLVLSAFGGLERRDSGALRAVLFAGEVFPIKHLRTLTERLPRAEFHNLYGPTETNVCTAARVPLPIPAERAEAFPIGTPCAGYEACLLDAPGGAEVPAGAEGLLHVAGPGLFLGYWKRDGETEARVFEREGRRWYDTGDVAREVPGEGYVYVGRRDRMVKRRGHRVELGEVESGLYKHPRIREAAVVALADDEAGLVLRAHLVPEAGRPLSILELKTFCASVLPASMVPDRFVFEERLPRTSTDKIDYQTLRQKT
ncbi:MAG: amino acid adenylation domain-containing protein [Planctomycetota bacterium]